MTRIGLALALWLGWLAAPAGAASAYTFPATGPQSGELAIAAAGDIEAVEPLIRDFQRLHPGYAITYTEFLTNELFETAAKACAAGKAPADLIFSSSADHMVKLANDGCAQRHESQAARAWPAITKWQDEVFGFTQEPAVIVYNRKLMPPEDVPRTHEALADLLRREPERYHRRIGTYDIARSGIGYLFALFDAQQSSVFGRLAEAFGRADARLACCTGELLKAIESGELLIGYNLLGSYAYARMQAGAPIAVVMPADYTLVLSRAALVPRHATRPAAGRLFLEYLLSARGQQVVADHSFFFTHGRPAPGGVDGPPGGLQSAAVRPIPVSPALLAAADQQKRMKMLAEWGQAFTGARP